MPKKKKLKLGSLKVNSFVTSEEDFSKIKAGAVAGTGNCLSWAHITCPEPCDLNTVGDYSCWIDGGCDTGRCHEETIGTGLGMCICNATRDCVV